MGAQASAQARVHPVTPASDVGRASDTRPTGRPDEMAQLVDLLADQLRPALLDAVRRLMATPAAGTDGHVYLSTSCLHGGHGYCAATVGAAGPKTSAQCKFCSTPCVCPCHNPTTTDTPEQVE